jgi:hypothetical protein
MRNHLQECLVKYGIDMTSPTRSSTDMAMQQDIVDWPYTLYFQGRRLSGMAPLFPKVQQLITVEVLGTLLVWNWLEHCNPPIRVLPQDEYDYRIKALQQFLGEAYDACVEADAKDREERAEAKQKKT